MVSEEGKFDVVHIQNSVLAGGVAMGVAADLVVSPYGAMICGFFAGVISVWGYKYLTPYLGNKWNVRNIR
jgi:ammonium transporter Rh